MKKIIFCAALITLTFGLLSAKSNKKAESKTENSATEEKSKDGNEWSDVGNQGKKALKETGEFFKGLGKKIGTDVKEAAEDASEVKCLGKWGFNKNTTIINVTPSKIEIRQKQGNDTYFWRGSYTSALKILTLTVEEEGTSSWNISHESSTEEPKKIRITYSLVKDDENAMKFSSADIPDDSDGNSFASSKIFTRL